ncbi:DUF2807 domain-containing protein [Chitinibacter fontanus]|uniref:DUF2807 domain-containing protein n=1 Tax=Chitinibacter fontanus TaxID=1737446 RepID=A0A7D5ZG55_9NEIS|nr:DUF2807 domain-containing protein [Chitinibacter fontanus]QLI81309.1 DUF2807 domain-containing protein [Chitinibacter fontanus]
MNKQWLFPSCVGAVLVLGILSNLYSKPNAHFTIDQHEGNWQMQSQADIEPSGKTVKIALAGDVNTLQQMGTIGVVQACAQAASIELDSALLAQVDPDLLKRGIIKTNDANFSSKMPAIVIHTAQALGQVDNSGTANVEVQCANPAQLAVNNRGTGAVDITTPKIAKASVDNYGVGDVRIRDVNAIQINNWGTGNVQVQRAETAKIMLLGVGNVSFANAPQISSTVKGVGEIKPMFRLNN